MSIWRTDRMREALSVLRDRGEVDSRALQVELRVSAATLRHDLGELEEQGLLVRTHGGARALDPSGSQIPVRLRDHRMIAIERRIAQHAAALIPPGPQAVALTGGVTTGEVARSLQGRPSMTIVTNSLTIAADCAVDAHMKVIVTGGLVRAHPRQDQSSRHRLHCGRRTADADRGGRCSRARHRGGRHLMSSSGRRHTVGQSGARVHSGSEVGEQSVGAVSADLCEARRLLMQHPSIVLGILASQQWH